MEDINDILESIATNYNELEQGKVYMKQQISDFYNTNKIKIDFNYCHIAISRNGGLIAICKKPNYLDISKSGRLNNYVIVMFQDSKTMYEIKIDWDFKKRWIVCLGFTQKQELYGILNDGGIFKFKYNERIIKEKVTAEQLKKGIKMAKFIENGFIAYTNEEKFYYIKDIKNPIAIKICETGMIGPLENVDFLIINPDNSHSKRIELLITNEKGNGVIHIEQVTGEDQNFQIKITDENITEVIGINLILTGKLQPYLLNSKNKKKEGEYPNGFGEISAIAISPSGKKIAFYNSFHHVAFIMNSNFNGEYSTTDFKFDENDYTKKEINEFKAILEYKQHNQFLFCGENAVAISGQRYIIISGPKSKSPIAYLIKEGSEFLAMQGNSFCKCLSEIDGLRILTNEGVYLINEIAKELYDISYPFSSSKTKNLINIYLNTFLKKYNSHKDMKTLPNLEELIMDLQLASANIFWTKEDNNEKYKEAQLFLLKAAQYGKNFVNKIKFNFDKYNERCKDMRINNQIRNDERYPIFITFKEYERLSHQEIIEILIQYKNFKSASQISKYLEYDTKRIMYKYTIEKMKHKLKQANIYSFSSDKTKDNENEEETIYQNLLEDIQKLPDISYVKLAKKAIQFGSEKFAMKLLDQEKSALTKIPQLLELNKLSNCINISFETFDFNILSIVLRKITEKTSNSTSDKEIIGFENLCKQELQKHHSKIILFFKKYKLDKLEYFLLKTKDYKEILFMKLNDLFKCQNLDERIAMIKEIKAEIKNYDSNYKKYIDNIENNIKVQKSWKEENITNYLGKKHYNENLYDYFTDACKKGKFNWIEGKIKNFEYSNKKLNIIRFRTYLEMNNPSAIDSQLEKTPIKKLGLTPINMAEIYYDYKYYDKAAEYLLQVKEPELFTYVIELLRNMKKSKEALEIIIPDKNIEGKEILVRDILKKEPDLKNYVDELSVKYKVSLW